MDVFWAGTVRCIENVLDITTVKQYKIDLVFVIPKTLILINYNYYFFTS